MSARFFLLNTKSGSHHKRFLFIEERVRDVRPHRRRTAKTGQEEGQGRYSRAPLFLRATRCYSWYDPHVGRRWEEGVAFDSITPPYNN